MGTERKGCIVQPYLGINQKWEESFSNITEAKRLEARLRQEKSEAGKRRKAETP